MKLIVNGKPYTTNASTLLDLKEELQIPSDVTILNGFQVSENLDIKEGDLVTLIQKGKMPSQDELESMMCARHTPNVHHKVKEAKVAIAGLGGLGSNIAILLARTGVGTLFLVDFDVVEPSNLNRQSYYISHLGLPKTEALKQQIEQINPFIQVKTKQIRVTEEDAHSLFEGYPIVCEAFDHPISKAILVNTLLEQSPQTKLVCGSGMAGYGSSNTIQTVRKMKHLYVCGDGSTAAEVGNGLMAPRVTVCAAHQANMVLRLILGIEEV